MTAPGATMLTHVHDLGFRTGEFTVEPMPDAETARVLAILAARHGAESDAAALVPDGSEAELRGELAEAAPGLSALATAIRDRLESSHSGVLIRRAHLGRHDLDTRRRLLYALAVGIGAPTATDRIDRKVVWDIKLRPELVRSGAASTFSEHADEADFHTDTQYFPTPERYMLLYFARAAACGGGRSSLRDARCVRAALAGSDEGRWALDLLSQTALPFRIPATFTRTGSRDAVEVTFATVFGDRPLIRFRTDTLRRGLAARPEHDTPEIRRALAILQAELDNPARRLETFMESDSLLAMNNHEALHGRGAFADPDRHALRIRIDDGAPQDSAPQDQAR
ncbi:TauD/TfdA family dioxygenase [Azospirillum brasilense]|nr:TauD/TfdA family dioxygenase [Azospirillum brasilense]